MGCHIDVTCTTAATSRCLATAHPRGPDVDGHPSTGSWRRRGVRPSQLLQHPRVKLGPDENGGLPAILHGPLTPKRDGEGARDGRGRDQGGGALVLRPG